jgi:MFS family permease
MAEAPDPAASAIPLAWTGRSDKRSYRKLFVGYVLGLVATGVASVALTLLVFDLAGDDAGVVLGMVLSLKMLAYVCAAPVAAALTERLPRKPLMIALDLIRAGSLMLLPFVTEVWPVLLLVFAFALASATVTLVYQTVVPYLLGSADDYARSLARSRVALELENGAAPLLAAALLLLMTATGVFVAATAAFLASALLVAAASLPRSLAVHPHRLWGKVLRGPRLFLATPDLRGLLALDVAVAAAIAMVMVNTVVLVEEVHDLGERAVAVAFGAFGLGSIAGALALPRVLRSRPERSVMFGGGAFLVVGLVLGVLLRTYHGTVALWLLLGLGVSLALTPATYLIRRIAPPADLQTLFAAQLAISNGLLLIAFPAAGWLGAAAGMSATFLTLGLAAAAATIVALWLWPVGPRAAPRR